MADAAAEENGWIRELIGGGIEIAGGAVGGALGFLAGGPAGAAALGAGGSAVAAVLKHVGTEMCERYLGPREKVRVGGVLALAAAEIDAGMKAGVALRTDGFFDCKLGERSGAEEVAEDVLLKSQREPEERKLPYMAHLLAAVSFDTNVSPEFAHQLTKIAEQLTYRQLCILSLAANKHRFVLHASNYLDASQFPIELRQVLYECFDLYNRGLLSFGGTVALSVPHVAPGSMEVQGLGADMFNLMKLAFISDAELVPLASVLK